MRGADLRRADYCQRIGKSETERGADRSGATIAPRDWSILNRQHC